MTKGPKVTLPPPVSGHAGCMQGRYTYAVNHPSDNRDQRCYLAITTEPSDQGY